MNNQTIKYLFFTALGLLVVFILVAGLYPHKVCGVVVEVEWETILEISSFTQVHVDKSIFFPPSDAYNVVEGRECRNDYNSQTENIETNCDVVYSYDIDRYVKIKNIVNQGKDRTPVFLDYFLVHQETYGNQKIDNRLINYYVTTSIRKGRCQVDESFWNRAEEGQSIKAIKINAFGVLCRLSFD